MLTGAVAGVALGAVTGEIVHLEHEHQREHQQQRHHKTGWAGVFSSVEKFTERDGQDFVKEKSEDWIGDQFRRFSD
jgi:hypothetical protein